MSRSSGDPKMLINGDVHSPTRIDLDETLIDEAWLQARLHQHPELLPVEEIGSSWGPLISLGREIQTDVGPIDNLFASPNGELTLVEAKLWRNPESRRKVVGQILDYASNLRHMTYEDLDHKVAQQAGTASSIWKTVLASNHSVTETAESNFVDTLSRNLAAGRFLLLIVGDGIRQELESIAELLGQHPDMGFHLELVEMRLYDLGTSSPGKTHGKVASQDILVIPQLVGRTSEVTRATIEVLVGDSGDVNVTVEATIQKPEDKESNLTSVDDLVDAAESKASKPWASLVGALATWWEATHGSLTMYRTAISLSCPTDLTKSKKAILCAVYDSGVIWFDSGTFVKYLDVYSLEELNGYLASKGLTGNIMMKFEEAQLTDDSLDTLKEILTKIVTDIRTEENKQATS